MLAAVFPSIHVDFTLFITDFFSAAEVGYTQYFSLKIWKCSDLLGK